MSYKFSSLLSTLTPSTKGYSQGIKRKSRLKKTSFCKDLQTTYEYLLNALNVTRTSEKVKYPISKLDERISIVKFMTLMQIPPGVSYEKTKEVLDWWLKLKSAEESLDQAYDEIRVDLHGPDSAATHFFTERQASVRLKDEDEWIIGGRPTLKRCVSGYFVQADRDEKDYCVEAIDCTNFHNKGIGYEGLKYLKGLEYLSELILRNQTLIDTFCLDRIAGQNGKTLQHLDITGCKLNASCFVALDKMEALKTLKVTEPKLNSELRTNLALLKKYKPNLIVQMEDCDCPRLTRLSTKSAPRPLVIYPRVCRGRTPLTSALKQPYTPSQKNDL